MMGPMTQVNLMTLMAWLVPVHSWSGYCSQGIGSDNLNLIRHAAHTG